MKRLLLVVVASILAGPAFAESPSPAVDSEWFSALEGVYATPLDAVEMDQIHGTLTGQELFDALLAKAMLITDPALQSKVVAYLQANQTKLVAYFDFLLSLRR